MKTVSLELSSAVETVYLKTKKIARTHENITFCNNLIWPCQTSRTYRQGNYALKLTLIITSQGKVIERYLSIRRFKSASEWQESHKSINTFSRSTAFCFPAYPACRRVHCRVIQWSSDFFHCSNSTVLHSMIKIVDLPYNTRD